MKAAKVYEGWEKVSPGSDEYRTIGTTYYAGYSNAEEFEMLVNSGIAEKYNVWEIESRVINGDGAAWITSECENDAACIYQLDLFHIYSKASKKVKDKKARKMLHKLIKENKWDKLIERSKQLWEQAEDAEKANLKEVYDYYNNFKDALKRYWEVLPQEILSKVPNGEIRGMGTMESSIHNTLADRMKGVAWSEDGANSVAKALSILHSSRGDQVLGEVVYGRELGFIEKGLVTKMIKQKENQEKRDIGAAVQGIIKETKKKRKYGGLQSHVGVLDSAVSPLTVAIKGLLNRIA